MIALPCDRMPATTDVESGKTGPCGAETRAVIACEPDPGPMIEFQF